MQGIRKIINRYLPKSLFGRALLILLLPILLLQAVVVSIFVQRHFDAITEQMASAVARELNAAIARIEAAETMAEARAALNEMAPQFGFEMGLSEGSIEETRALRTFYDFTGGFGNLLMMGQGGHLSHEETVANLTLFAKEVQPRLQELHSRPLAMSAE